MPLAHSFFKYFGLDRKFIKYLRRRDLKKARAKQSRTGHKDVTAFDLGNITRFFYLLVASSVVVVVWHCGFTRAAAAPLLWAFACASVGAAFGFLFGIPKILQGRLGAEPKKDQRSDYQQQVNTNLTEISDWLTKIIVGLGLIHLGNIPDRLNNAALTLASSVNAADPNRDKAFALALIVCYLIVGFLFGYLSTRLVLQKAFSDADQSVAGETRVLSSSLENVQTKTEFLLSKDQEIFARLESIQTKTDALVAINKGNASASGSASAGAPIGGAVGVGRGGGGVGFTERTERAPVDETFVDRGHVNFVSDVISQLHAKANEYMKIGAESVSERIRLKDKWANDMLNFIVSNKVTKEMVFGEAERSGNEGLILALANYVLTYPRKDDLDSLLRLANRTGRLHVKYRIVQAIGELFDKNCADSTDAPRVLSLLDSYEPGADRSVASQIKGVRTRINRALGQDQTAAT